MSFEGDLGSLPITDIIQLLHSTGKSGTLSLNGPKGESQLVFDQGYIVSANHVNNSMRIGRVLVDMGALKAEELESALAAQARAGKNRAPLVATLLEAGRIQTAQAYKGLEILIELTIVEVLTWSKGSFSLDTTKTFVSDEYGYFPQKLKQDIYLNTQSVLMDALRIYDEKKRDGTLMEAHFFGLEQDEEEPQESKLSADDLGLGELDFLETRIPAPFHGLTETGPHASPRDRLRNALAGAPEHELERLFSYLNALPELALLTAAGFEVLLLGGDPLLRDLVAEGCGGLFGGAIESEAQLPEAVGRSVSRGKKPVLLLAPDERGEGGEAALALLERTCTSYPHLFVFLLLEPGEYHLLANFLQVGVSGVLPRPGRSTAPEALVGPAIGCLGALRAQLETHLCREPEQVPPLFLSAYQEIADLATPPEVTLALLHFVSSFFPRAVTFVQLRGELVAEKGIGIAAAGSVSPVKLRIPLDSGSLLKEAVERGRIFFGAADPSLQGSAFATLGAPAHPQVLLLPVKSLGRVIAVLYGDFGAGSAAPPPLDLLRIMAQHAGLVIDNALYRRRAGQNPAPQAQ